MRKISIFNKFSSTLVLSAVVCVPFKCRSDSITISTNFEAGAAENIKIKSNDEIRFSIPRAPGADERLWFYFRVTSPVPIKPWFVLENETEAHQGNWDVVRPVFSKDGLNWVRAQEVTRKRSGLSRLLRSDQMFRFRSPISSNSLWVAYSYPYTTSNLQRFIQTLKSDNRVRVSTLGRTEEQREITKISIEASSVDLSTTHQEIWIICREHPGETPASFVLEGLIDALLSQPAGRSLLSKYRFRIVPMLNTDGVVRGNYYRNSKGIDLAQDWGSFKSAEVRALYKSMRKSLESNRVRLILSLHSANDPKSHFFLETPESRLPTALRNLQRRLIQAAANVHPQLQISTTVKLWDHPVIAGNYLSTKYGVYCLYCESNYNIGADGTVVTPDTLRDLGAALIRVFDNILVEK